MRRIRRFVGVTALCAGLLAPGCSSPTEPESDIWVVQHDFPRVVSRGQEVTFTATMVGTPDAGTWSRSGLTIGWLGPLVTLPSDYLIAWEGAGVGKTRSASDSIEIFVYGRAFTAGTRLSVTAKVHVRSDIQPGLKVFSIQPNVTNTDEGGIQVLRRLDYEIEVR